MQKSDFSKSQNFQNHDFRKIMIFKLFRVKGRVRARHGVSTRVATHVLGGLVNLITTYHASYAVGPLEQNWSFPKRRFHDMPKSFEYNAGRFVFDHGNSLSEKRPLCVGVFPSRFVGLLQFRNTPTPRWHVSHHTQGIFGRVYAFIGSKSSRRREPNHSFSINVGHSPLAMENSS